MRFRAWGRLNTEKMSEKTSDFEAYIEIRDHFLKVFPELAFSASAHVGPAAGR